MSRISPDHPQGLAPGLVISHYGNHVSVENREGDTLPCFFRQDCQHVVVGDHVMWRREKGNTGVVTHILPRKSLLSRHHKQQEAHVMAANIDAMVIMLSVENTLESLAIDRYLVAAECSNIKAIIVLNKIDVLNDAGCAKVAVLLNPYKTLGYRVHAISTHTQQGLVALQQDLHHQCSIVVGQSGAGKSSLINVLLPNIKVRVASVSTTHKHGKHTTRGAHLYHLPSGGDLIDSAGIRHFHSGPMTPAEIARGFIEFAPFYGKCKFRNCAHRQEPGCALHTAVLQGVISELRFKNYHHLVNECL